MIDNNRLRIAVQKSGRLSDDSISLLKAIGIKLQIRDRLLIAHSTNQPIDLLLVRDDDIPGLVMDGVVDLGFIGQNELEEKIMELSVPVAVLISACWAVVALAWRAWLIVVYLVV